MKFIVVKSVNITYAKIVELIMKFKIILRLPMIKIIRIGFIKYLKVYKRRKCWMLIHMDMLLLNVHCVIMLLIKMDMLIYAMRASSECVLDILIKIEYELFRDYMYRTILNIHLFYLHNRTNTYLFI